MFRLLADKIVDNRWAVLFVVGVLALLAASYARRLEYDFTLEALFYGEQEERTFSQRFNELFAHEDNLVVIILEATTAEDVLTAPAVKWQAEFVRRLEQIPGVDEVKGLSTIKMPRPRLFGGRRSPVMMVPVIREDEELDAKEIELIRRKVAETPLLDGMLISRDGTCAAVAAYLSGEVNEVADVVVVVDAIEEALSEQSTPAGYRYHVTGLPAVRLDISRRLRSDQHRTIPICVAVFLSILVFMYRRLSGLVIPWASIAVGLVWTSAALVYFDQPLNIVTNVLPVLLMVVGMSNCVHLVSYFSEQALQHPDDRCTIAKRTLRHMIPACLLTCLTTAIGFLSLLVADAEVLTDFGWQAAMGMGFVFLATILVAGSLMPLMKAPRFTTFVPRPDDTLEHEASPLARFAASLGQIASGYPKETIAIALVLVLGAAIIGRQVHIDSRLIETYDDDHPVVRTMELAEEKLGGFMPLEISLEADDPRAFQDVVNFFRVAQAIAYLTSLPEVTLVRSYVDQTRQMDRILPGKPLLQETHPIEKVDADSQTARRLRDAHRHLSQRSTAEDSGYRDYLAADGTHGRIAVHVRDMGIRHSRGVFAAIAERLEEYFPKGSGIDVRLTGDTYYSSLALSHLIKDLFYSLVGAALVIFLVISCLFRSIRVGVASILPNLTPLVMTLGYMGLRGYPMSTGNVIVFAISLGIAVDDTIHFLARFCDESNEGGTVDDVIRRTCLGTGRAIVMTTLLIVAGLSVVLLSEFVPTRRFAELTSVTMCSALLGDLVLLPACLKLLWQQRPNLRMAVIDDDQDARAAS